MLLPRELDPVAAGSDVPLPPPRPGLFSLNFESMADPTAPDSDNVPLPEAKPEIAPSRGSVPAAATNAKPTARHRR